MTMTDDEIQFDDLSAEQILNALKELDAKQHGQSEEFIQIKKQLSAIQEQANLLARKRMVLEEEMRHDSASKRELQKKLERARRLELVKEEQDRLAREFAEKTKELDELTKSAKWREFAFDHQIEGGKKLAIARRGICADKRGLGKTLTSLIWGDMVQAKRILVIAPNDVVEQFEEEIKNWAPTRTIFPLRGLSKSQRDVIYPMLDLVPEFIITLNYEAWRRDKTIIDDLVTKNIDSVIIDEAHRAKASDKVTARGIFQIVYRPNYCPNCDKVDNFYGPWEKKVDKRIWDKSTETWKTVKGTKLEDLYPGWNMKCPVCGTQLESTVKNVLCMTGTPILNKPQELFSLLFLVDHIKFPSEKAFLTDYCTLYAGRWRFRPGGVEKLTKFMSNFFIQRNRNDAGIEVPPPSVTIHHLAKDLDKYALQYAAEQQVHENACLMLANGERKDFFFILELILRERQIMTWPEGIVLRDPDTKEVIGRFDVKESQKVDAAEELLAELLEEEERVIVFSQFKAPLYELHDRLKKAGHSVTLATGDQPDWVRKQVKEDFDLKTDLENPDRVPRWSAAFATYKAFGTGVNLNGARHMILLDDEWNPGMEDQAIGRIDRINSTDQANVHIFRVRNSVDDFMAALIEQKRGVTGEFEDGFSMDDLKKFFE